MSIKNITKITFVSEDLNSLNKLYDYLKKTERTGSFLQYYHPEDYFNNKAQLEDLYPDFEHKEENVDYRTLAFVDDGPEWGFSDEGHCFSVQLVSQIDPPVVYIKELCDLCFKDSDKDIKMSYISENETTHIYLTNVKKFENSYDIEYYHKADEETDEIKVIEGIIDDFQGEFITQDVLIERLSPLYSEAKDDLDIVLNKLEEKYKDNLKFTKVAYCPYGKV